jgi:hypothetical protein
MLMQKIEQIPISIERDALAGRLGFAPAKAGFDDFVDLIETAQALIRPGAVYQVTRIGRKGQGTIEVAGIVFQSSVLRQNLDKAHEIFPYIITVGPELEKAAAAQGDLLRQYYLEEIANFALEQAADWLAGHLEERFGVGGLSSLSPGSLEDWPITEQTKLFSIFGDTEKLIGVRLTDSMLMIPRKSISGIFFPSEEGFSACQLCERERCSGRKAPFKAKA